MYFIENAFINEDKKNEYNRLYKNKFTVKLINDIINSQQQIDILLEEGLKGYNTIENLLDTTREGFRYAKHELQTYQEIRD